MEGSSMLFEKTVPVKIRSGAEERHADITIRIILGRSKNPRNNKVLQVQIVDELDPFFLYSLEMSEEDFQNLKVEQCILVDFSAFPHKFIELLEHCVKLGSDDQRFLAVFDVCFGDSTLKIVETNNFKHVNHISLCFRQGNDFTVKSYLAGRLSEFKGMNVGLHQKLQKTLESLERSIQETDKLKDELSSIRGVHSREVTELNATHSVDVSRLKEKSMQECVAMKEKLERDRADMEYRLRLRADAQESHVVDLDRQLRELTTIAHNLELKTAEYKAKLEATEKDLEEKQQECSSLRKKNVSFENKLQEYSKQINQHLIRLAALEQEVQAKNELLTNMSQRLEGELSHRTALEKTLRDAQAAAERAEEKSATSMADANRLSQALERLQGELRACKAKVKLKAQVAAQQDTLLHERQVMIEKSTVDSNNLRQEIVSLKSDNDALRRKVDESKEKMEEMQELSKSNQQMIQWLNQQLTDSQLKKFGHLSRYSYKSSEGGATRGFATHTLSSLAGNLSTSSLMNGLPQLSSSSPVSVTTTLSTRAATNGSSPIGTNGSLTGNGISKVIFRPPQNMLSCSATPTPTPLESCSQTSVSVYKSDNAEANQRTFTVEMKSQRNITKPQLSFVPPYTSPANQLVSTGKAGRSTDEEAFSSVMSSPVSTM